MIELKKLRKTYRSLRGGKCVALKDIDLKLPDTGLVFIIGKSGSGKSTLLNLLGGLDTITSGDIIADGNSLADFKKSDFEDYRSSYIGFVFQHYYLLDELTVKQNVELAMAIVGKDDENTIKELLGKVGLDGCEDRYPKELSGGQQQRVAIARALAKDPKLILGDELTGNLDHKTSVDILNVLKEISKEKLVIVVSHNLDEADMFADRIIELHDGEILRDRVRVNNDQKRFFVKDSKAYLPYFRDLTSDEAEELDRGLKSGRIRDIVQQDDGFALSTQNVNSNRHIPLEKSDFAKKRKREYAGIFIKKGFLQKLVTIMIVTVMLLCVSVFSSLHKIRYDEIEYEKNTAYIPVVKGDLESLGGSLFTSFYHRLIQEEIDIANELLGGKSYILTSYTVETPASSTGYARIGAGWQSDLKRTLANFYVSETYGTLICDEEFLINEYGVNGEITVLAGDLYNFKEGGVIITDYVADAFLKHSPQTYSTYKGLVDSNRRIIAVIDTDYESKYGDIKALYDKSMTDAEKEELHLKLCEDKHYRDFLSEVIYSLGIGYTFDENFIKNATSKNTYNSFTLRNVEIESDGVIYDEFNENGTRGRFTVSKGSEINSGGIVPAGTIKMSYAQYNNIFGTRYTVYDYETHEPHNIILRIHDRAHGESTVIYEKEFTVVLVNGGVWFNGNDFSEIRQYGIMEYGMYLENNENTDDTIDALNEFGIYPRTIAFDAIAGINKILSIFLSIFKLIGVCIYVFIVVYIINHAMTNIKKNYFQIGVMRAFGAKSMDVGVIFITSVLLTGAVIALISVAFEPLIISIYNKILVESFALVLSTYSFDVNVINMPAWVPLLNCALVIMTSLISALISLLFLRNLKPIEIIRAKDNGGEVS